MFYGERVIDIPDGLPKWTGLSDIRLPFVRLVVMNPADLLSTSPS